MLRSEEPKYPINIVYLWGNHFKTAPRTSTNCCFYGFFGGHLDGLMRVYRPNNEENKEDTF